ncbi:hydrolase, partial [Cupriavidus sp. KB_39]
RDWKNKETYDAVTGLAKQHSGAYGMGIDYAYTMVHKAAQRTQTPHASIAPVHAPVTEY